jgi:hypothetical protein
VATQDRDALRRSIISLMFWPVQLSIINFADSSSIILKIRIPWIDEMNSVPHYP